MGYLPPQLHSPIPNPLQFMPSQLPSSAPTTSTPAKAARIHEKRPREHSPFSSEESSHDSSVSSSSSPHGSQSHSSPLTTKRKSNSKAVRQEETRDEKRSSSKKKEKKRSPDKTEKKKHRRNVLISSSEEESPPTEPKHKKAKADKGTYWIYCRQMCADKYFYFIFWWGDTHYFIILFVFSLCYLLTPFCNKVFNNFSLF